MIALRKAMAAAASRAFDFTVRADSDDYVSRFANLELDIGRLTSGAALEAKLREIGEGVQTHVRGQLAGVRVIEATPKQRAQVNDFVAENVRLIRKMAKEQVRSMHSLVTESVGAQWTQAELKNKIQESFGFSKSRSELIARDQTLKINASSTETIHREAGVTSYRWVTSHDERVRGTPGGKWPKGTHYGLDGKTFEYNNPPVVDTKTGRRANPGVDFQCRCTAVPNTDDLLFGED